MFTEAQRQEINLVCVSNGLPPDQVNVRNFVYSLMQMGYTFEYAIEALKKTL